MKTLIKTALLASAIAVSFNAFALEDNNANLHGSLNTNNNNTTTNSNNDSSITEVIGDTYQGSQISNSSSSYQNEHTSSAISPTITSGYDTCAVGTSGAIQAPGFGASFGKATPDATCERLKLSKMLVSLGLKDAALALMLQDDRVEEAMLAAYPGLVLKLGQHVQNEAKRDLAKK